MARLIPLKDVIDQKLNVFFDSNTLINGFKQKEVSSPVRDLIVSIALNRRFITELVAWQFLHPTDVNKEELRKRKEWLSNNGIRVWEKTPPGYFQTFSSLLNRPDARGDAVDAALAAYSIAYSSGKCVVATNDGDDFCWHSNISVITDFLPSDSCE